MKLTKAQQYNLDVFRAFGGSLSYTRQFKWYAPGEAKPILGIGLNWVAIRSLIDLGIIVKIDDQCTDKVDVYALATKPTAREIHTAQRMIGIGARA